MSERVMNVLEDATRPAFYMMSVGFATTQSTTTQHHGHISPMDVRPFLFRPFRLCPFLLSPLFLRPTRSSNATYILTKLPRIAPIKIFLVSIPTYISSSPQDPHPLLISTREKERRRRKKSTSSLSFPYLSFPLLFLSSLYFSQALRLENPIHLTLQ